MYVCASERYIVDDAGIQQECRSYYPLNQPRLNGSHIAVASAVLKRHDQQPQNQARRLGSGSHLVDTVQCSGVSCIHTYHVYLLFT